MVRTGQTVEELSKHFEVVKWRSLDEINAGLMDGLTYEEFAEMYPDHYEARKNDKLGYRYPRGESYLDVFQRLEPVIFEMLRQRGPLLIVGHQAILRVLYGYLTGAQQTVARLL
jgi:6-phosphofructo-2-kinase/fructose-2,6-biphosphatase